MLKSFKKLFPHELRQNLKRAIFSHQDMQTRMVNLRRAGFTPKGAIDGGAYQGDWTRGCWIVWPKCPILIVEPLAAQSAALRRLAASTPGSALLPKALGKKTGQVHFLQDETNSRIVEGGYSKQGVVVECITLDDILRGHPGFNPNLLKLDLQGNELSSLAGAVECLKKFEVIILEVSVLRIGDVPLFSEVDSYMQSRDYRLYDVLPTYYRPLDGALWQMDVFYVRTDSELLASRQWA